MKKYEAFVQKWKAHGQQKIYFVTMDIEKCYDSVDVKKLNEMLQTTQLLEKEYNILNCIVMKRKNNVINSEQVDKDGNSTKEPFKNHFRHKF